MSAIEMTRSRIGQRETIGSILNRLADEEERGGDAERRTFATGFEPLDTVLSGGVHTHDLVLVGGAPGVGKTIAALQWARNMAACGVHTMYLSYEHEPAVMAARLLSLEMGLQAPSHDAAALERISGALYHATRTGRGMLELAHSEPLLAGAFARLDTYSDKLHIVQASGAHTGLYELLDLIESGDDKPQALFVDYLQKVAVKPAPEHEEEKVLRVAEGLKDMAMELDLAIIAIAAADAEGLRSPRLRLHHVRGSTALAYECDAAVMLNDKHRIVSKAHLAYDAVRAKQFHREAVFSVEKNRGGPNLQDLEFTKQFHNFRFDPEGGYVAERLVNERIDEE